MKTLSTVASEYRGIGVEERGSEFVISSCVSSYYVIPLLIRTPCSTGRAP